MATKYARAAGGAWATDATWSTTSGGAADTTAPGASDDAVIDTNSGAVTSITGSAISLTVTNGAVKTTALTFSGTLTLSGAFSVTGNSAVNRIICQSTTLGTARTISAASASLTNVDFRDITGAGAATWSGTSIGNALGNTNITADTPITCYRVGAGGNWSTANWYTTSGGATPARVPLPQDNAVVDANASGVITNDMPRIGADISFAGFAGTFNPAIGTSVQGSIVLGSGMTLNATGSWGFYGRSSHTITSNGVVFNRYVIILGGGGTTGTYTLADAYTNNLSAVGGALNLTSGTFNDGGFSVSVTGAAGDVRIQGGALISSGTWTIASTTATTPWDWSAGTVNHTGTIVLSGATATARTFAGGDKTYGTLTDQNTLGGKLTITGANTFGTINKPATVACTLALPTSSGITVTGQFNVNGIAGQLLTLTGDVTKVTGTVVCAYLSISSSDATGGASFYAGRTSTNGGSNSGWQFVDYITGVLAGSGAGAGTVTGTRAVLGVLAGSGAGAGTATGTRAVLGVLAGSGTGSGTVTGHSVGPTPATSTPEAA